jgi:hypothetical protein
MYAVKTGRWGGVVTAFITMSDIKDEIDWECECSLSIVHSLGLNSTSPWGSDHRRPDKLFLAGCYP